MWSSCRALPYRNGDSGGSQYELDGIISSASSARYGSPARHLDARGRLHYKRVTYLVEPGPEALLLAGERCRSAGARPPAPGQLQAHAPAEGTDPRRASARRCRGPHGEGDEDYRKNRNAGVRQHLAARRTTKPPRARARLGSAPKAPRIGGPEAVCSLPSPRTPALTIGLSFVSNESQRRDAERAQTVMGFEGRGMPPNG
jgi:hypothetical protein